MERKIGEIFELSGEWFQCVESKQDACTDCAFNPINSIGYNCSGSCAYKKVIFNKLEKVGEPYQYIDGIYQQYKAVLPFFIRDTTYIETTNGFAIKTKQIKENMEENMTPLPKEDNHLTRIVYAYVNGKISDEKLIKSIKEMSNEYPFEKNNLKPFSLEAAKAGKPVCTRDGRKARIICFDFRDVEEICCLIAAVDYGEAEKIYYYDSCGKYRGGDSSKHDLMMLPEKRSGWVNVYKDSVYDTKDEALIGRSGNGYIDTIKVEWEE